MTPSFLTSKAIGRGEEENWRVKADNLESEAFLLAVDMSMVMCGFKQAARRLLRSVNGGCVQ
jgi:hypothetical protein